MIDRQVLSRGEKPMRIQIAIFSTLALALIAPTIAHADQDCKDVLIHKVMDITDIKKNTYYSTSVLATLNRSSDQQSDKNGTVTVPGIGDAKGSDTEHLVTNLSSTYGLTEVSRDKSSYLIMSGQKEIIDAWRDCMRLNSGLSLVLESFPGGNEMLLHLEYLASSSATSNQANLELEEDVYVDKSKVDVVSGSRCLASGRIFRPGDQCDVHLITNSPWSAFLVVFPLKKLGDSPKELSYSTYVAPRAVLEGKKQPWGPVKTGRTAAGPRATISEEECFTADDGYTFLEDSIAIAAHPEGAGTVETCFPREMSEKKGYRLDQTGRRFCVQQVNRAKVPGDLYCSMSITATEAILSWNPPEAH
jgi:hypothetical protein